MAASPSREGGDAAISASAIPPMWRRAYLSLSTLLLCGSIAVSFTGGLQWQAGPFSVSITRGWRLATIAFAIWMVGAIWDRIERPKFLVLVPLAGMLVCAAAESEPQRVGDSHEYVAMARGLAEVGGPARPLPAIEASLKADWNEPAPGFPLVVPSLRGADGRYDFPHFWFYPALAAPFIPLTDALGLHVRWAFFAVNLALLLLAAAVLAGRFPAAGILLMACGPILWWVDKPHTEVFTWSLLTISMCSLGGAPWWALVALGAAATQNPPFAPVLLLTLAWIVLVNRRAARRVWAGFAAGAALAALAPIYSRWRLGMWSTLSVGAIPHRPSLSEYTAVLLDPNIGILPNAPVFLALLVAACVVAMRRAEARRSFATAWYALLVSAVLLAAFSQAANFNSGGTPNPSRYGLWLTALFVPAATAALQAPRALIRILATLGLAWSLVFFHPHLGDHYLRPTPLAAWLWEHVPGADNPLPEIFCERLSGREGVQDLPLATPGCSKALLAAGPSGTAWPAGCHGGGVPAWCAVQGALCYANAGGSGWGFAEVPKQAGFQHRLRSEPSR
jgi:hypothetical protein